MKHLKKGKKFHRKKGPRQALFKSLINTLILNEKIETTEAKAKEIKSRLERLITITKKQNLSGYRLLLKKLNKKTAQKLFYQIGPRYQSRAGGYLRIIKNSKTRKTDGAKMTIIEFV
jgi:large subunit ribosomal protein L17